METEKDVRRKVLKQLKKDKWMVWSLSDKFAVGYPDLICFRKGPQIKIIELKRPKNFVIRKLQHYYIKVLKSFGFDARIISSVDQIYD